MQRIWSAIAIAMLVWLPSSPSFAEEVSREQIKGLDEQVQDIKGDVLGIAAELHGLEEKLLYPSNTQVSLFVSMAAGEKLRLDSVEIELDGKPVSHYLYSAKELDALQRGGVQRIYTGNVKSGEHQLRVSVIGKNGGSEYRKSADYKVTKEVGPKLVEIKVGGPGSSESIAFKDW